MGSQNPDQWGPAVSVTERREFGRSGIPRVYALRHHKPRSPDGVRLWSRSDGHIDRELSSGGLAYERSHRESEFHESREQLQQKPRNRDEGNPD
jgi:hypothetical protein